MALNDSTPSTYPVMEKEDSSRGDFASDMKHDREFLALADHGVIHRYLERSDACSEALDAFEELWRAYAGKDH